MQTWRERIARSEINKKTETHAKTYNNIQFEKCDVCIPVCSVQITSFPTSIYDIRM